MRTAIFVYELSSVIIGTTETGAELSSLDTGSVTLSYGNNARSLARGIYKVVSNEPIEIRGETSELDLVVTTQNKENGPTPPIRAAALVDPIGASTLQAFFAVPEAKTLLNP
jgi:hypothetical protein